MELPYKEMKRIEEIPKKIIGECECGDKNEFEKEQMDMLLSPLDYWKMKETYNCSKCNVKYNRISKMFNEKHGDTIKTYLFLIITIIGLFWGAGKLEGSGLAVIMYIVLIVLVLILWIFHAATSATVDLDRATINQNNILSILEEYKSEGESFIDKDYNNAIVLNEEYNEIYLVYSLTVNQLKQNNYTQRTIGLDDILLSEVIIDNETITSTSRGSQIGGAVVGGVLLGGVGAIVGGLSGKTKSAEEVQNLEIKLTLKDLGNPVHKISFLNNISYIKGKEIIKGHDKNSQEYKNAILELEKWQGIFEIILNRENSRTNN